MQSAKAHGPINQQYEDATQSEHAAGQPSFEEAFDRVEQMLGTKASKFAAINSLLHAEAKLSLSAFFLWAGLVFAAVISLFVIWGLVNLAFGLWVLSLSSSVYISIATLLLVNLLVLVALAFTAKWAWSNIGLPRTLAAIQKGVI